MKILNRQTVSYSPTGSLLVSLTVPELARGTHFRRGGGTAPWLRPACRLADIHDVPQNTPPEI